MSELICTKSRNDYRWQLLTTVSALALIGNMCAAQDVKASDDTPHPLVWVELGGQFDMESNPGQTWMPPNVPPPITQPAFPPFGKMPSVGYDWDGKVSVQPNTSGWTFSASVQFGKSKRGPEYTHDQGDPTSIGIAHLSTLAFTNSRSASDTSHLILDFQAGKDVGIGMFAGHGSSAVNVGIRIAQFWERASGIMSAQLDAPAKYKPGFGRNADMNDARDFSGIGPTIDWKSSVPLGGSLANGIVLDWGVNAAILFGRQKAKIRLHTADNHFTPFGGTKTAVVSHYMTSTSARRKQIIVPDIGGFAGLSYRMGGRGKIALGYRADFFFGAIDGGIETRKSENVGFYGPFASISIGIGG